MSQTPFGVAWFYTAANCDHAESHSSKLMLQAGDIFTVLLSPIMFWARTPQVVQTFDEWTLQCCRPSI